MFDLLLLAKEGRLNERGKDCENDQDTGFANISEMIASKTTENLKSKEFFGNFCFHFLLRSYG